VTRPGITSMAQAIRLNWRRVVPVTWSRRHWKGAHMSMRPSPSLESCRRGGRQLDDRSTTEALPNLYFVAQVLPNKEGEQCLNLNGHSGMISAVT